MRELIRNETVKNAIIFCNRKVEVAILHRSLVKHGFSAGALHGDMDQKSRMETLDKFRAGELMLLAASDVAARGLDIPDVSHIFNYDLPWQSDDYVHRIGRTGRAGKEGHSLSLVTTEELKSLKDIEKMLGEPVVWIGEGPSEQDYAEAGKKRRRGRRRAPARTRARPRIRRRRAQRQGPARREPRRPAAPSARRRGQSAPSSAAPEQPRQEPRRQEQPRAHEQPRRAAPTASSRRARETRAAPSRRARCATASGAGRTAARAPAAGGAPRSGFADNVPAFLRNPSSAR